MDANKKKAQQLGMPYGTANGRLKKIIMFELLKELDKNICFRCSKEIKTSAELSVEHKIPWLDNSSDLFWSLDNIAFSHLSCNCGAARSYNKGRTKHPSIASYRKGCRCAGCKEKVKFQRRRQRADGINT